MSEKPDYKSICQSSLGVELEPDECRILADVMSMRHLEDGELLVKENEADNTLFVLIEGKLAVTGTVLGQELVVYTMKIGECAGTRAFVDRTPRKATLRAIGHTTVYMLKPDAFEAMLDAHPRIVYKIMRALFRITHTNLMRMNLESQELVNYVSKVRGRY
ncbi:MAG: cyclic nucleotide-binding domain-containing protein [Chromatiales bacterium]|jgi:CRP-like cAMP-binding protein|nr:cyclic nucleotide-binding domain-containing protein [Chromatiales bacterium]